MTDLSVEMRRKVFERAGWRCERCGARYPLELYQVDHTCIVLCVECQTRIHQAEQARRHMGWRT